MEIRKITETVKNFEIPPRTHGEAGSSPKGTPETFLEKSGRGEELSGTKLSFWVEKMNTIMEALAIEARFAIHEATHTVMVTLVNRETGEVIRQIPPEKLLDMVARFRELAGLFVDEVV